MKRKRWIAALGAVLALSLMAGCQSSGTSSTADNAKGSAAEGAAIFGQVTAIDGSSITIALGTMPQRGGTAGERPSFDTDEMPSGEMPSGEIPSGEMPSGEMPSGEMPSGEMPSGGMWGGIELTGEEQSIMITDSTVITLMGQDKNTQGSISDIEVGDMLNVTISGDTVTAITVMGGFDNMQRGGNAPGDNPDASANDTTNT